MRICFASHNPNKIQEIAEMAPEGIEIFGLNELGFHDEIPETGTTIEENSRIKAKTIHSKFHIPVFADDSGLEVSALNGEPGVFSARYAGPIKNDKANMDLLLKNLKNTTDKSAQFKTVITYIQENGSENQFTGIAIGEIIETPRGDHGFGYDPIFVPEGYDRTFSEMTSNEKHALSHRAKAFQQLLSYLNEPNG